MSGTTFQAYIEQQKRQSPDDIELWNEMEKYYNTKLWHQLGELLLTASKNTYFSTNGRLVALYNGVAANAGASLDPMVHAKLVSQAVLQLSDHAEANKLLDKASAFVKSDDQATMSVNCAYARAAIEAKELTTAEKLLEKVDLDIKQYPGVLDNFVPASYHSTMCSLYRTKGDFANHFRHAMRYLNYFSTATLSQKAKLQLASEIAVAALLGEDLYDIAEFFQNPLLEVLRGSPKEPLFNLLTAFNAGDITRFESELQAALACAPELEAGQTTLQQRIRVMKLIALVFAQEGVSHVFTFRELAEQCQIDESQVELLVLQAIANKVIKAEIDGVENEVRVRWVKPRTLDADMLTTMRDRVAAWRDNAAACVSAVENSTNELLVGRIAAATITAQAAEAK